MAKEREVKMKKGVYVYVLGGAKMVSVDSVSVLRFYERCVKFSGKLIEFL